MTRQSLVIDSCQRRRMTVKMIAVAVVSAMALTNLVACKNAIEEYDQPLTYWADPKQAKGQDGCVYATAQAILKSGLPYPNIGTETIQLADGKQEQRNTMVDVWVGSTRLVLPAKLVKSNGAYPTNRPERYWKLGGSLPNFWPVGEPGPTVDGMGSMVDITIQCSVEPTYVASWGKGYRSNAEGIEKTRQKYLDNIKILAPDRRDKASVTINVRQDLGMTEVLFDRAGVYPDGQPQWEAGYWPLNKELKGADGSVSGIGCTTRHDDKKRYGGTGWRCNASLALSPEATAKIEIYVSQLQHLPSVFEQVRELFESAKQN